MCRAFLEQAAHWLVDGGLWSLRFRARWRCKGVTRVWDKVRLISPVTVCSGAGSSCSRLVGVYRTMSSQIDHGFAVLE